MAKASIATVCILLVILLPSFAHAIPPASPYEPGETTAPACEPNTTNCTVRHYAVSGVNNDITSLTGLTTPLSVVQGGTGLNAMNGPGLLFASASSTLSVLSVGSNGDVLKINNGVLEWGNDLIGFATTTYTAGGGLLLNGTTFSVATSSLGLLTTDIAEGSNQYFTTSRVKNYVDGLGKGYFFATSSADNWLSVQTSDLINQGTVNKYYNTLLFAADLAGTTTAAIREGATNQYFTASRTDARINATSSIGTLTALPNLTTVGTITSGVWNGTPIDAASLTNFGTSFYNYFYGTSTDALGEGTNNLFWTINRFDSRLAATTSLPNITTLAGLSLPATQLTNFGVPLYSFLHATTTDALVQGSVNKYYNSLLFAADLAGTTTLPNITTLAGLVLPATQLTNFGAPFYSYFHGTSTDALSEGTNNLFWTNNRFDSRLSATSSLPNITTLAGLALSATQLTNFGVPFYSFLHATTTDAITQGTSNKYYNTLLFAADLAGTTTAAIREGATNQYFTASRTDDRINATSSIGTLTALPNLVSVGTITSGVWNGTAINASALSNFGTPFYTYFHATSSDALNEGTANKFYSDTKVGSYISGSSTIPNVSGSSAGSILSWNGSRWTSAPTTTFAGPLTYSGGAVNINDNAIGNNLLTNSSINFSAGSGLTGGGSVSLGGSGSLSLDLSNSNAWSGLQKFNGGASTTMLSVTNQAYFGGTATSSFSQSGALSLANIGTGMVLTANSLGVVVASSTPTVTALFATSTTATTVLSGSLTAGGILNVSQSTGRVGIGTATPATTLHVKGDVSGIIAKFESTSGGVICSLSSLTGLLACVSDERLKKDITKLGSALDVVMALNPVSYKWKEKPDDSQKIYGFIAQDVEKLVPELVSTDPDSGYRLFSATGLIPFLTKAIQEINVKVGLLASSSVNIKKVQTDNLCVGATCVSSDEFLEMVETFRSEHPHVVQSVAPAAPSEDTRVSTSTESEATSSAPEIIDTTPSASSASSTSSEPEATTTASTTNSTP